MSADDGQLFGSAAFAQLPGQLSFDQLEPDQVPVQTGVTRRERLERRAERLRGWADGRDAKADAAYEASRAATEHIPFGQPILIGHHSERGHRADLDRSA